MLVQCCVCKRVEMGDSWKPADGVIYDASHTYCPDCAVGAQDEILAYQHAIRAACLWTAGTHSGRHRRFENS